MLFFRKGNFFNQITSYLYGNYEKSFVSSLIITAFYKLLVRRERNS